MRPSGVSGEEVRKSGGECEGKHEQAVGCSHGQAETDMAAMAEGATRVLQFDEMLD